MRKITLLNIIKNGGATLNAHGKKVTYKKGYQVSKKDYYKINVNNISDILNAINDIKKTIAKNEFCGLWVDSGYIYIDISERITDKNIALEQGRKLNQISIFGWAEGLCFDC